MGKHGAVKVLYVTVGGVEVAERRVIDDGDVMRMSEFESDKARIKGDIERINKGDVEIDGKVVDNNVLEECWGEVDEWVKGEWREAFAERE